MSLTVTEFLVHLDSLLSSGSPTNLLDSVGPVDLVDPDWSMDLLDPDWSLDLVDPLLIAGSALGWGPTTGS